MAAAIYEQFKKLESEYEYNPYRSLFGDIETTLGLKLVQVTLLPQSAFPRYIGQRQAEGADLGHLKPPHINPSDKMLSLLGAPKVVVEAVPTEVERAPAR